MSLAKENSSNNELKQQQKKHLRIPNLYHCIIFLFLLSARDQNVILVLMHHTRDENYSTAGIRWSEIFPNVILDVHVVFHETVPGLLKCTKNIEAVNQVVNELDHLSQNQQIRSPEAENETHTLLRWCDEHCFAYWKVVVPIVLLLFFILILVFCLS